MIRKTDQGGNTHPGVSEGRRRIRGLDLSAENLGGRSVEGKNGRHNPRWEIQ
jgi:hypothetical protein